MRDLYTWSFPIGQVFGIVVRVHILMPLILGGFVLSEAFRMKEYVPGAWIDALTVMTLLFLTVLLHEFGHCAVARLSGGDAREVLLWPLGGLTSAELPQAPAAHFLTALGGPLVNAGICLAAAFVLGWAFDTTWQPPWNPLTWNPYRDAKGMVSLVSWTGDAVPVDAKTWNSALFTARLFYVSWVTLLLNLLLIGFPLDAGRLLQASLWPWFGYRQATLYAVFTGFGVMFFLILLALIVSQGVLILLMSFFIYSACAHEWRMLASGGDDSLFGYDFSQGYTSLEKEAAPAPRKKPPSPWQRWLERRRQEKMRRDEERRLADERRMDELLQKIAEQGKAALTDEETRFMKRVAERYRNRNNSQ